MKNEIEPVIEKVGSWMPTMGPFSEAEFEDLNNFHHFFQPAGKDPSPGQPSYKRILSCTLPENANLPHRTQLKDISNFSKTYLDQTPEQFLSVVENTAAEIGGSFKAVQEICCKWAKDNQSETYLRILNNREEWDEARHRTEQWLDVRNRIYRALRERGYAIRELIQ